MLRNSSHLKKHKSEHVAIKYLNNAQKNKIQKVKNSILELKKYIKELKDRNIKIRRL